MPAKPKTRLDDVDSIVAELKRLADKKVRDGMARYAIPSDNALGIAVGKIRLLAKQVGRNHDLTAGLWKTGIYEARMLCAFIADPERVTPALMDRWTRDFDNWAICDTLCFHLFDRAPHALAKVKQWADHKEEFVKRTAFALLASVALHDKSAADGPFDECLPLIERAADDDRNFVKKAVSWALRSVGRRKSGALRAAALALAKRLAASKNPAERWLGKDVLRDLARSKTK